MKLGVYTLHMPRKKVLREVSPKKDLKQRSVSIDTPLKWIELCKELLKLGCPPEDLQRIKGSKWEVVFPTEKQAQEVGGSRWRVGAYTLLPRYLGEKKAPTAPVVSPEERKEKEDRRRKTEAYQDWRMGSLEATIKELASAVASLIKQKVSNEHVLSPGAQPLMLKDTIMHTPTQTSEGGPADTTMRLEPRTEGLGAGGTHESNRNTSSTTESTSQVNKYPTSAKGTITPGQQPFMPSDTYKHEGTHKDVEMEDTKITSTNTTSATKVVLNTTETKEDEALVAYMAARAGSKAAEKAAQEEAQKKVREVEEKAARDAAQKAAIDAAQKAAQEAAKAEERKVAQEATRKAEELRAAQEVAEKKKKDADELEMRRKIMEEET